MKAGLGTPGGQDATGERGRLRPAGHLACLVFCLVMPALASGWEVAAVAGVALSVAAYAGRQGVAVLADWRTWLIVAALVAPAIFVLGRDASAAGAGQASRAGLALGAQVTLRALTLLLAVSAFAASVSVVELGALAERAGLGGIGFALGVAINALPTLAERATHLYHAVRLRGGFRRRRLEAVRLWLIAVVVASLRHADQVVGAAEARAFVAERPRRLPVLAGWPDALVALLLAALAVAILA